MGDRPVEDYSGMPRELADVARRTLAEEQELAPFPWNGLRPFTPEELADGCGGKALDVHSATGTVRYHAEALARSFEALAGPASLWTAEEPACWRTLPRRRGRVPDPFRDMLLRRRRRYLAAARDGGPTPEQGRLGSGERPCLSVADAAALAGGLPFPALGMVGHLSRTAGEDLACGLSHEVAHLRDSALRTEPRGGFPADRVWCYAPGRASRPRAGYLLLAVGESVPATRYPFGEYFGGSGHELHVENFAEWYALWRCFPERCPEAVAVALDELLGLLAELGPAGVPPGRRYRR